MLSGLCYHDTVQARSGSLNPQPLGCLVPSDDVTPVHVVNPVRQVVCGIGLRFFDGHTPTGPCQDRSGDFSGEELSSGAAVQPWAGSKLRTRLISLTAFEGPEVARGNQENTGAEDRHG